MSGKTIEEEGEVSSVQKSRAINKFTHDPRERSRIEPLVSGRVQYHVELRCNYRAVKASTRRYPAPCVLLCSLGP